MKKFCRVLFYTSGMLILALGITLNTKAGLGVSPIISVSYFVSTLSGLNFGDMTLLLYTVFVAGEFALRGRRSRLTDLLQLPLSLVFSRFLNLFTVWLPYDSAQHGFVLNLAVLAAAVVLTGIGICLTINMRLIPNPGDGIVQALAERMNWEQGFAKNVFDFGCVTFTVTLSLVTMGHVVGINIGTVIAMLCVGRVVALVNGFFKEKMCAAAGLISAAKK